jgi:radical SAM superfamily enzyme YgiQ (UPF0313 family)
LRVFNGRTFRFSLLSLLTVAAATPRRHEVRILDEQVEDVPFDAGADLVGITCMTALAPRAYEIAARFRERGVPVVLGGMHPTLCAVEALEHADAVVAGEAEGVWEHVLADAAAGRLGGVYRSQAPPDLARLSLPPRHLLQTSRYSTVNAVQATRGCPHQCSFCSVSVFSGHTIRFRPVGEVAREVASIPSKFVLFVDDNMTADRDYALALFKALEPLDKWWMTQSTLALAEDSLLVAAAARAGCIGIFAGMETFNDANLDGVSKSFHRAGRYREAVRTLNAHGIGVEAGIVFGFDGDGPEVFQQTLSRLDATGVDMAQVSVFTPLPGTPAFGRMAPRILDRDWSHYDFHRVVFEPERMSAEALQAGHDWVTREFYRPWRIARRLARRAVLPRGLPTMAPAAAINAAYYGRVARWHIRGWNPAETATAYAPHGIHGTPVVKEA